MKWKIYFSTFHDINKDVISSGFKASLEPFETDIFHIVMS